MGKITSQSQGTYLPMRMGFQHQQIYIYICQTVSIGIEIFILLYEVLKAVKTMTFQFMQYSIMPLSFEAVKKVLLCVADQTLSCVGPLTSLR